MSGLAGTFLTAYSQIQAGRAQASIEEANAALASLQARQIRETGVYKERQLRREKAKMLGRQKALYAKAGIVLSEGSPLEVMADTATEYEMDISAIRYNTAIETARLGYESAFRRRQAESYKRLAYLRAASTILTSAYDLSSKVYGKS